MSKFKVAVIMGGTSFERDFSLASGEYVAKQLEKAGHEVLPLDADNHLVETLRTQKPDVAVVALHGQGGEDGVIPALLEFLQIPFVGSRSQVCRATWNKSDLPFILHKAYRAEETVVRTPHETVLSAKAFKDLGAADALDLVARRIGTGFPLAVKPAHGGSALGCSKVDKQEELGAAIMAALAYDDSVLIQQWVEGVELSCCVIGQPYDAQVLPPVEISAKNRLYDTYARQHPDAVDHFAPVRSTSLSQDTAQAGAIRSEIERAALEVFNAFGCRDLARVDMIWDGAQPWILDVKVFPGMAESSLLSMASHAAQITPSELFDEMVHVAYERGY